jgi:hypothetical protein
MLSKLTGRFFTTRYTALSFRHCHQQNHMDLGFMMLFTYA